MKSKKSTGGRIGIIVTVILVLILAFLSAATIIMMRSDISGQSGVPFDLEKITSTKNDDGTAGAMLLIPSMIGITSDPGRYASSASAATTSEIYRAALPVIAEVLSTPGTHDESDNLWESFMNRDSSLYIRYHHEFADCFISSISGSSSSYNAVGQVYEMFLLPYSESSDSVTAAVRSLSGDVFVYTKRLPENILTADELDSLLDSYRSALTAFDFSDSGEPVFTQTFTSRNILMSNRTSMLVPKDSDECDDLLRLFRLNPDKLLNKHTSTDGTASFIDAKGIFYIFDSSFAYQAVPEGGVKLENYTDYQSPASFSDYVSASYNLFLSVGNINRHFTGGDADIILASAESHNGRITLRFEYIFDNIRIVGCEPALTVTFENERLTEAKIYTMSARNLGTRSETVAEWWSADYLTQQSGGSVKNVFLAYECDFVSESISAEWFGEYSGTVPGGKE